MKLWLTVTALVPALALMLGASSPGSVITASERSAPQRAAAALSAACGHMEHTASARDNTRDNVKERAPACPTRAAGTESACGNQSTECRRCFAPNCDGACDALKDRNRTCDTACNSDCDERNAGNRNDCGNHGGGHCGNGHGTKHH